MDEVIKDALRSLQDVGIQLGNAAKLCDLDHTDVVVCLHHPADYSQRARD